MMGMSPEIFLATVHDSIISSSFRCRWHTLAQLGSCNFTGSVACGLCRAAETVLLLMPRACVLGLALAVNGQV